jgi:transposase
MDGSTASEARRLRVDEQLSAGQIRQRLGLSKDQLYAALRGVPPLAWTRRPNAKDELRARAIELRGEGWSVNDIALELHVAKSTAWLWVRHLPLDPDSERARRKREHSKRMTDARWDAFRRNRDAARAEIESSAEQWVGELARRELLLLGAVTYWCEGSKSKPWRTAKYLAFINSDPVLIDLFIRFVEELGVARDCLSYRVAIHESADVAAATQWWADRIGVPMDRFQRVTLKRHNATTNRLNTGTDYRGCLVVRVSKSRQLYWWIEGVMRALAGATASGRGLDDALS